MSSAQSVMDAFAASQGWNESTQLALLLVYVDNLADQVSLQEFLQHHVNVHAEGVAASEGGDLAQRELEIRDAGRKVLDMLALIKPRTPGLK